MIPTTSVNAVLPAISGKLLFHLIVDDIHRTFSIDGPGGPSGVRLHLACPVAALRAWLAAAAITEGALFRRVWNRRAQRVGAQRLTPRIVANIVRPAQLAWRSIQQLSAPTASDRD
jgi:hypothetical protein